jgi:hypothetical protein
VGDATEERTAAEGAPASDADSGLGLDVGSSDGAVGDRTEADAAVCPSALTTTLLMNGDVVKSPGMTRSDAGFAIVMVAMSTGALKAETVDGTGALTSGPKTIDQNSDHTGPRIGFSGTEYGITYLTSNCGTYFIRTDTSFVPIPQSLVALNPKGTPCSGGNAAAVAWSNGLWGVTWSTIVIDPSMNYDYVAVQYFQSFDVTGAATAPAETLGRTLLPTIGTPIVATSNGWAVLGSGVLYEIPIHGSVHAITLPVTGSLAANPTEYAVVGAYTAGGTTIGFVRVQIGGGVVSSSVASLGSSLATGANIIWNGQNFVAIWAENAYPLAIATIPPDSTAGAIGGSVLVPAQPGQAGTVTMGPDLLVAGECGWAFVGDRLSGSTTFLIVNPF